MKKLGIIGCGRIGRPLVKAVLSGEAGDWSLLGVLTRSRRQVDDFTTIDDAESFFSNDFDLVIDVAGPDCLKQYGLRALSVADLWTVNSTGLADADLYAALEARGRNKGHRLRIMCGAISALDGLAALTLDSNARLQTTVDVAPGAERKVLFKGSVAEAAKLFPDCVNVALTTSLVAANIDAVEVEVVQPGPGEPRTICLRAESKYGQLESRTIPAVNPPANIHMLAAGIVAALRQQDQVIWVS